MTRLNSSGFGAHGFVHPWFWPIVLHVMEPIKGWKDFIVNQGLEVSGEGSLGRIGQGFGQWLIKFHWLGFSPDLGFSRLNVVFMLMICCWHFMIISLGKFFIVSAVHNF